MTPTPKPPRCHISLGDLLLLFCLAWVILPALADDKMEIIELKGRTPQEMIPLLRPFVGPEGTVTGMHNSLIVRTTPDRMAEVRRIIGAFDKAPRRLLIHVRETAPSEASRNEIGIATGNHRIRIGEGDEAGVTLKRYTTRSRDENVRTLQTLEGEPTLIQSGVRLPVVTSSGYVAGAGPDRRRITYGYTDADSGFYAIANLVGDRVRVEITTRKERPIPGSGAITHQESRNMVTGGIGEWLHIAGIRSSRGNDTTDLGRQSATRTEAMNDIWVKVEVLP
jgi:hypothetical protein